MEAEADLKWESERTFDTLSIVHAEAVPRRVFISSADIVVPDPK
jgi:hypothetical protein